jgi:two-component sensor histidine kinase
VAETVLAAPIQVASRLPDLTTTRKSTELLLTTDANGRVRTWTAHARQIFDVEESSAVGRPLHQFFRPSDATGFFADLAQQAAHPQQFVVRPFFGGNGLRGEVPISARMLEQGGCEILTQITDRVAAPAPAAPPTAPLLTAAVPQAFKVVSASSQRWPVADLEREKLLLTETHHRIKNHLQIISSLLNMQINGVSDQDARDALRSSQNRVRAIAALQEGKKDLYVSQLYAGLFAPNFIQSQPDVVDGMVAMGRRQSTEGLIAAVQGMIDRKEHLDVLDRLQAPILLLMGKEDALIPRMWVQDMIQRPALADAHLLPGIGHLSMVETPRHCSEVIRSFYQYCLER